MHHIERGALLAHEQHAFATAGIVGNQVGDGLGLARPGRPLNDEAAPAAGETHGRVLGGVRGHHIPLLHRWERRWRIGFDLTRIDRKHPVKGGVVGGLFDQLPIVLDQRHLAVVEVGQGHLGEIEIPGVAMTLRFLKDESLAHPRFGLDHPGSPQLTLGRRAGFESLGQRAGANPVFEQRLTERSIVVTGVAVGRQARFGAPTLGAAGRTPPHKALHALQRLLADQPDRCLLDATQFDGRLGAANLCQQIGMDRGDGGRAQVRRLGQIDPVQLIQVMAQDRIEFGLGAFALDDVLIAHPLALDQSHRQPQQRREDAFVRAFLQVVPAQKRDHHAQVAEAILGAVPTRFGDQAIERRRQVGLVVETQPALQRDRVARQQLLREGATPGADLFCAYPVDLQHQGHAGNGQIDAGRGGLVVEQAVAPRDVEEPVAQMPEHRRSA